MSCFATPNCEESFGEGYLCIRAIAGSKVPCKCVSPKGKPPAVLQNVKQPVTEPKKPASVPPTIPPSRSPVEPIVERPQIAYGEKINGVEQGTGQAVAESSPEQFVNAGNLPLIIAGLVLGVILLALVLWHDKHKPKHRR
jgi:hypothetical protein